MTVITVEQPGEIADTFGGPGGWSEALRLLGLTDVGYEWDEWACATRTAAGHRTVQVDVAQVDLLPLFGSVWGLIGSPPCQLFSTAGKKAGRNAIDILVAAMRRMITGDDCREEARLEAAEAIYDAAVESLPVAEIPHAADHAEHAIKQAYNACLVLEPARWSHALRPEWIALEQVPAVLPLWEVLAAGLKQLGYSTWTGILNSADFGVPQTRRRAFLMASRVRKVHPPEPTHERVPVPTLFGELEKWVSMAEALGWSSGRVGFARRDDLGTSPDGYRERDWRSTDEPAQAVTEKARSWTRQPGDEDDEIVALNPGQTESQPRRRIYPMDEPSPTIAFGKDAANWKWVVDRRTNSKGPGWRADPTAPMVPTPLADGDEPSPTVTSNVGAWTREPLILNTGRDWKPGGTREDAQTIDCTEEPAPTLTSRTGRQWQLHERRNDQSESGESDPEWPFDRPATTIAGRPLVPDPGTNANRFNGAGKSRNDGYRITLEEASVLQSFEADYPWQGSNTACFTQVGNCVPPRMAVHVLAAVMGLEVPSFERVPADA